MSAPASPDSILGTVRLKFSVAAAPKEPLSKGTPMGLLALRVKSQPSQAASPSDADKVRAEMISKTTQHGRAVQRVKKRWGGYRDEVLRECAEIEHADRRYYIDFLKAELGRVERMASAHPTPPKVHLAKVLKLRLRPPTSTELITGVAA